MSGDRELRAFAAAAVRGPKADTFEREGRGEWVKKG